MWVFAGVLSAVGLAATLLALYSGGRVQVRGPRPPDWLLPSPVDLRRARFPFALRGYDPAHVDTYLDALATAYEELYFAAGPMAVVRARERLANRRPGVTVERSGAVPEPPREA